MFVDQASLAFGLVFIIVWVGSGRGGWGQKQTWEKTIGLWLVDVGENHEDRHFWGGWGLDAWMLSYDVIRCHTVLKFRLWNRKIQ